MKRLISILTILAFATVTQADVTIPLSSLGRSGATTGQVPQWNGSRWVPAAGGGGGSGDVALAGANAFTGANSTAIAFRTLRTDLASGTSLAIGTHYYKTLSANLSLSGGFTGTPAEGSTTSLKITNAATYTVSGFPASKRFGEAGSGITSITLYPGTHLLSWLYVGGEWTMSDTVGLLHNDTATADPTAAADASAGYTKRSLWTNTSTGAFFVCVDATTGAAVWKRLDNVAGSGSLQRLGSHTTPNTAAGSITWTADVLEVYANTSTTYALPAAAGYDNRAVIFYNTGANAITIDPNASEVIVRDGTVQTGGVTLTLTAGAGNYVVLTCDGVRWVTLGFKGTLAAGS